MLGETVGNKIIGPFSDGELLNAGDSIRVFNIHILASGTATPIVTLKNNGAGGTTYIKETGTISTGKTVDYGVYGQLFPKGCYVSQNPADGSVLISFKKVLD